MKKSTLFIILLCCINFCFAQGKTEGLPISVKINTPVAFSDGSVEIAGTSNSLDNELGQVILEILRPNGATENFTARADKQTGDYLFKYMPKEMGEYKVIAYAADKQQTANTSFTVQAEFDADEVLDDFDKTKDKTIVALESAINGAVAADVKPEDVAKTKQELQKLKTKIKEFDGAFGKIKKSLKDLQGLAKKYPEIKAIAAPQLGQLASKLKESSDILKQVEKDLGQSKSNDADICSRYYKIGESCALFSTTMNFASGGIIAIGKSIFIDKVWPKIEEKIGPKKFTANDNFLFTQAGKTGLSALDDLSSLKTKSFGAGMAGDLVQFISNELFKKYCTEYKGPVKGDYTLEFKNNGKMYMRYKLTYEGKISVYCRKDKLKGTLPKLSGYLEGNVTKMDFTDDVWAVEEKSDWDEIKNQRIPAPVIPISTSENDPGFGAAARAAVPGSFYFPLQAQIVQGKMVIKLMPALSDFTDAFANRTVVVARAKQEPHNVSGAVFNYPVTTARFILTRSMRMPDKSPTVTIDIKTANGVSSLAGEYHRTESPNDTKVDFNMTLKMTNE
ncbi:MAG: hypothetical protein WDM90_15550 [Ferruginibacter sp.]